MRWPRFNGRAVWTLYKFEIGRATRHLFLNLAPPVILTALYFVVFGTAIGARMGAIDGVSYGVFMLPGLILLAVLTEATLNTAFGIYFPKLTGMMYEISSAPVSALEVALAHVAAGTTKSAAISIVILAVASLFIPISVMHPSLMALFLLLTATTFSLLGFLIGLWAKGPEQLHLIPILVVSPLTFLGGVFYSIDMLPPAWRTLALLNPITYVVSGYRWTFFGKGDVAIEISLAAMLAFLSACVIAIAWMCRTGVGSKN